MNESSGELSEISDQLSDIAEIIRHKKFLTKLKKLCILIQIKSDLLELFYLAFYIGRFYEI
jgi:hypothetical protein